MVGRHLPLHDPRLFKALLFLGAGVVISSLGGEHDIFKMGGLRRRLPVTFWTFLIGLLRAGRAAAGHGGFYSKDWILCSTWTSPRGGPLVWALAELGVLLTGVYTFRLVFVAFFGEAHQEPQKRPGALMLAPLVVLAVPAALIGFLEVPDTLGNLPLFSDFLHTALPPVQTHAPVGEEVVLEAVSQIAALAGLARGLRARSARPGARSGGSAARPCTGSGSPAGASTGSTTPSSCGRSSTWPASTRTTSSTPSTAPWRALNVALHRA